MSKDSKKLTLIGLILMIFTSVLGFANAPVAFYRMGYAAIPWYVLAAIVFFISFALMMAEFGLRLKRNKVVYTVGWRSLSDLFMHLSGRLCGLHLM